MCESLAAVRALERLLTGMSSHVLLYVIFNNSLLSICQFAGGISYSFSSDAMHETDATDAADATANTQR